MISHIVGAAFGVIMLILSVTLSAIHGNPWAIVGSAVYGATTIIMFTVSSVYHGLHISTGKQVMRVIDHCDIYFLIAGTYTPILLVTIRPVYPVAAWVVFGLEWGLTALAVTLTAIDLKKFSTLSMICYIGMGWGILFVLPQTLETIGITGFILLLAGGVAYTVGAVLYGVGKKVKYMHSLFHLFVIVGSLLQFFSILFYVI